jgi:hypothetical protein
MPSINDGMKIWGEEAPKIGKGDAIAGHVRWSGV